MNVEQKEKIEFTGKTVKYGSSIAIVIPKFFFNEGKIKLGQECNVNISEK